MGSQVMSHLALGHLMAQMVHWAMGHGTSHHHMVSGVLNLYFSAQIAEIWHSQLDQYSYVILILKGCALGYT